MPRHLHWLLSLVVLLAGAGQAAEPEFKVGLVTASRVYERPSHSVRISGFETGTNTVTTSRVTVAVDGMLITGEWVPKTLSSPAAKEFRRGSDVPVAVERNKLLLKLPDGSVVEARIVDREKPDPEDEED